jgi:hypothetical protein
MATMGHKVYSLSKIPDHRVMLYQCADITIKTKSSYTRLAAVHQDKDFLRYHPGSLMNAKNREERISKTTQFTSSDYLIVSNQDISDFQFKQPQKDSERLRVTQ